MATMLIKLRRQALAHQQGRCFYCGLPVWEANGKRFAREHGIARAVARYLRCTAEHLVARQDRGASIRENIVAACWWCNHQRHHEGEKAPKPDSWQTTTRARVGAGKWHPAVVDSSELPRRRRLY